MHPSLSENFVFLDIERKKSKSIRKDDFSEVSKLCNIAGELLSTNGRVGRFDCFRFKAYPSYQFGNKNIRKLMRFNSCCLFGFRWNDSKVMISSPSIC